MAFGNIIRKASHTIGRKFSHVASNVKKIGRKIESESKSASAIGKKIARGISTADKYVQSAAPLLAAAATPIPGASQAIMAGAEGIHSINTGIHDLRTEGAAISRQIKDAHDAGTKSMGKHRIDFGDGVRKPDPRPAVLK